VGQPRHRDRRSTLLGLEIRDEGIGVTFVPVEYDLDRHLAAIDRAGFSHATRERLRSFFGV